jgi:hypothetical protein
VEGDTGIEVEQTEMEMDASHVTDASNPADVSSSSNHAYASSQKDNASHPCWVRSMVNSLHTSASFDKNKQ